MEKQMDLGNPGDKEENERELLVGTSVVDGDGADKKIPEENALESYSDDEKDKAESDQNNGGKKESEYDDSDDNEEEEENEIRLIQASLAQNPYDYEAHRILIDKLHEIGDLNRLRLARENMSSKYPLTPEIWLSWIRDEISIAVTSEQRIALMEICERAVNDYLSVEVWLEYLKLATQLGPEKDTIEKTRNLFERALTAAGLHVMKGRKIWDSFREFENFLMENLNDPEKSDHINRIGKLYRRELACPLHGMEKTFEEYSIWRCAEGYDCPEDEKIIKSGYERASKELEVRLPFELQLESVENKNEHLNIYKEYLITEKQIGDPGRVTILYERSVADLSLEPSLWLDYLQYVENNIKIDEVTEKIYVRAVRNVPWCVEIWQNRVRFSEKKNCSLSEVQKLIESALAVGFSTADEYKNLWLTYLEYLRRRIDKKSDDMDKRLKILENAFERAFNHLTTFDPESDPSCEILQFWARTEAIHRNDMQEARSLWANIMSRGHSESAASWLEYISLERCYGDTKHLRKLFSKALVFVKDWPESIANAWFNFERDEGTLEQLEICEMRIKDRLDEVKQERNKSLQKSDVQKEIPSRKTIKRKIEDGERWKNVRASATKVSKFDENKPLSRYSCSSPGKSKSFSKVANNKPKGVPPPGYEEEKVENTKATHTFDKLDKEITIFVSNLDYTATEEDIREALKSVGPITTLRMVTDYKGRSKGFCYVQLSGPEAVAEALKLDRIPVNTRPMFINRCDPDKASRKTAFKYKTDLEKNKLFVKGLPSSTTEEQLEKLFKVHGIVKDVRVVTYRNGHSKGLAYIDFEDETSASKAVLATDGMTIEDKVISVAISQPPQRKQIQNDEGLHPTKSLGGSLTSRSSLGNPKTVLSMIPRNVKKNITGNNSVSVFGNRVVQSRSNADFRNMLFNKKQEN